MFNIKINQENELTIEYKGNFIASWNSSVFEIEEKTETIFIKSEVVKAIMHLAFEEGKIELQNEIQKIMGIK